MKKGSFSFGGIKPSAPKRPAAAVFDDAPEPAIKQAQVSSNDDSGEIDPLDAFMTGISAKKTAPSKPKPQVSHTDLKSRF
jgi:hypothetical protein